MLDIRISDQGRVTIVEVHGRIDSSSAGELGEVLTEVIEGGHHQVVLDIAGVDYMSSAGLRELVAALKKMRREQGDLRLASVSERVYEVLELSGLNTIFQIFESQTEAAHSF